MGRWKIAKRHLGGVGRQDNNPQRYPCPDPQNLWMCYLHMAEGILLMWISLGSWDGEIILDDPSGSSIITRVRIRERERQEGQSKRRRLDDWSRGWSDVSQRWRKGPWAKECRWIAEARKSKEPAFPLEPPEGMQSCQSSFYFWPPEL